MFFFRDIIIKRFIIPAILVFVTPCASFSATGVKTSFKKYSLFTYNERVYLCEPYLVQKDEWLYKIFRQKGEISAADFPLFLKIFKNINPKIGNIDAISPGSRILIPLKQVDKNAYEQGSKGTVEVPVLAFSTQITPTTISQHTHKHEVKAGDTVSTLLSKEFLTSLGNVSKVGEKTMLQLNPGIKDINSIYQGASIIIPDPSILSQPWFNDFIAMGKKNAPPAEVGPTYIPEKKLTAPHASKPISMAELAHLKRYTQLIQGRLMHQGKLFFPPGNQENNPKFIDLSKTPVISDSTGRKTVLLGSETTEASLDPDLVAAMKAYWKDLQFKKFSEVLNAKMLFNTQTMKDNPNHQDSLIKTLLAATAYSYESQVFFPVSLNNVQLTVSLGRITHDHSPDMLINSGGVYGSALDVLKRQGYRIINLPSNLSFEDVCTRLFSRLGYQVWKNPSFNADQKVKNIPGIYAEKGKKKLFLTRTPLFKSATTFLKNEKIDVIMLK
nr:LysM peptidoglycan-binding domain-containing protein [uncultured Desulfobacter sp.]